MKNSEIKYVFFTGGWDSTYMLLVYLRENYKVKPVYVIDEGRASYNIDLKTIEKIINSIKTKTMFGNQLLEVEKVQLSNVKIDTSIQEAYNEIKNKIFIGSQYAWLSQLSKKYGKISLGIEKPSGEYSGCVEAISAFGKLKAEKNSYIIDKDNSSSVLITLMGNFEFPIIDITENEMVENIKKWKFDDIMKNIWFCHKPINNKPCGLCRPCEQKMQCNMQFLLPEES